MKVGNLAARIVIGGLFVGHGTQKLFGWFGGPGLDKTTKMMDSLELRPPETHAVLAGVTEAAGGAMLAAGLATPLAAASLIGVMTTAIRTVHAPKGPWVTNGGYEYNAVLIAALLAIVESGPGVLSVDALRGRHKSGALRALGALALGVVASTVTIELGRRQLPAGEKPAHKPAAARHAA